MYIWVVLATFMLALYSFNLSHRADMKDLYVLPQAQPFISRVTIQHHAALAYIIDHTPNGDNGLTNITYVNGELQESDLKDYLPYSFVKEDNFYSQVYCLNSADSDLSSLSVGGCDDPDSENFLVTFACVPRRWINVRTNRPSGDLIKVLRNNPSSDLEMGFVEELGNAEFSSSENKYGADYAIRSKDMDIVPIPKFITDTVLPGTDVETSFSEKCGKLRYDEDDNFLEGFACNSCVAYLSNVYRKED